MKNYIFNEKINLNSQLLSDIDIVDQGNLNKSLKLEENQFTKTPQDSRRKSCYGTPIFESKVKKAYRLDILFKIFKFRTSNSVLEEIRMKEKLDQYKRNQELSDQNSESFKQRTPLNSRQNLRKGSVRNSQNSDGIIPRFTPNQSQFAKSNESTPSIRSEASESSPVSFSQTRRNWRMQSDVPLNEVAETDNENTANRQQENPPVVISPQASSPIHSSFKRSSYYQSQPRLSSFENIDPNLSPDCKLQENNPTVSNFINNNEIKASSPRLKNPSIYQNNDQAIEFQLEEGSNTLVQKNFSRNQLRQSTFVPKLKLEQQNANIEVCFNIKKPKQLRIDKLTTRTENGVIDDDSVHFIVENQPQNSNITKCAQNLQLIQLYQKNKKSMSQDQYDFKWKTPNSSSPHNLLQQVCLNRQNFQHASDRFKNTSLKSEFTHKDLPLQRFDKRNSKGPITERSMYTTPTTTAGSNEFQFIDSNGFQNQIFQSSSVLGLHNVYCSNQLFNSTSYKQKKTIKQSVFLKNDYLIGNRLDTEIAHNQAISHGSAKSFYCAPSFLSNLQNQGSHLRKISQQLKPPNQISQKTQSLFQKIRIIDSQQNEEDQNINFHEVLKSPSKKQKDLGKQVNFLFQKYKEKFNMYNGDAEKVQLCQVDLTSVNQVQKSYFGTNSKLLKQK